MGNAIAIAAIAAFGTLIIFAEGFHIAEAVRLRNTRKRYLEMIESIKSETEAREGDIRNFRKSLGAWEQ